MAIGYSAGGSSFGGFGQGSSNIIQGLAIGGATSLIQNELSRKNAANQQNFTREMRNTAYQATMADMARAGLNPILAYKQGATASGAGSMAIAPDIGAHVARGMQTAATGRKLSPETRLLNQQTATQTSAEKLNTDLSTKAIAEAKLAGERAQNTAYENIRLQSLLPKWGTDLQFNLSPEGRNFNTYNRLNIPFSGDAAFGIESLKPILKDLRQRYNDNVSEHKQNRRFPPVTPKPRPKVHRSRSNPRHYVPFP